jgi:hypothetical protein
VQVWAEDDEGNAEESGHRTELADREDGMMFRDELIPEALVAVCVEIDRIIEFFVGMSRVPVWHREDFDGPSVVGRNASADRLMCGPVTGLAFFGLEA